MSRADYMAAVGPTDYPPTEAQWQELEAAIQALRPQLPPGSTDRELLATDQATVIVAEWRERHNMEPAS